jgi:hypothetical protein
VTDSSSGSWFPDDVLPKWDVHHRPFFHGHDVTVAVPAGRLNVVCTRGIEFERAEVDVRPTAGERLVVECDPPRLFDPAAEGWYGGDLHVHMNYSGDLVFAHLALEWNTRSRSEDGGDPRVSVTTAGCAER